MVVFAKVKAKIDEALNCSPGSREVEIGSAFSRHYGNKIIRTEHGSRVEVNRERRAQEASLA